MATSDPNPAPDAVHAATVPTPGTTKMPPWGLGELSDAPRFTRRNWAMLLGPGLVMGGAAIGGGEWLTGPRISALYGGALLWLATLSIVGQVFYNMEISRYTLYTGEPIFTGKFRLLPGPGFWLFVYLLLDFGSVFPYLAANAATSVAAVVLGRLPDSARPDPTFFLFGQGITDAALLQALAYLSFIAIVVPLVVGGKVYDSLKAVMSFKIVVVLGFLTFLAVFYSRPSTWWEIGTGFVKFGTVPVLSGEDRNGNGILDPGEDWDGDGHLDVNESLPPTIDTDGDGVADAWADVDGDGRPDPFVDLDGDGIRDGTTVDNIFVALFQGRPLLPLDLAMLGYLTAMAAISGSGGLTNTTISGYTRDQGWGMGKHVGAIPSMVGGRGLQLSHVGMIFPITAESVRRFRRWYRHVLRDQLVVWTPACFLGIALPSMLSIQFLRRGTEVAESGVAAMTASGVAEAAGPTLGPLFWYMTIFCGFLVLAPSAATTADGVLRRWVDVFWTGSTRLRKLDPAKIRHVYFTVLCAYAVFGLIALSVGRPGKLLLWATTIYNFALGFSCWHVLAVNTILLPREIRPGWGIRVALVLAGAFFFGLGVLVTLRNFGYI
jgi:Mn2+/Fe2+ NRAMP family transporter